MKPLTLLVALLIAGGAGAQSPVEREAVVTIGGIRQYLTINGKDDSLPLLLFLHGGPGGSMMRYASVIGDRLQEHFLVVHWDQRETGKTLELNASPSPLTLRQFQSDTEEVIEWLLNEYGRDRLYLAGHSWGTSLGFHIAKHYPERLYAYLAIGAMINQTESERIAREAMLNHAHYFEDNAAVQELSSIRIPFEDATDLYYHRKHLATYAGRSRPLPRSYVKQWAQRWLPVFKEASAINLFETLPRLHCPVYFLAGRNDLQTNASLMEAYYQILEAPLKKFYWFERVGHGLPTSAAERMQAIIIEEILPETFERDALPVDDR